MIIIFDLRINYPGDYFVIDDYHSLFGTQKAKSNIIGNEICIRIGKRRHFNLLLLFFIYSPSTPECKPPPYPSISLSQLSQFSPAIFWISSTHLHCGLPLLLLVSQGVQFPGFSVFICCCFVWLCDQLISTIRLLFLMIC